jgi:hypothetical protein
MRYRDCEVRIVNFRLEDFEWVVRGAEDSVRPNDRREGVIRKRVLNGGGYGQRFRRTNDEDSNLLSQGGYQSVSLQQATGQFLRDVAKYLRIWIAEIGESLLREPCYYRLLRGDDIGRSSLSRLNRDHLSNMLVGTAPRDPASIDNHVECSGEDKIDAVVVTSLSDQSFAGRDRENLHAIGQLFREFSIASDDFLRRERLDADASAPLSQKVARHYPVFLSDYRPLGRGVFTINGGRQTGLHAEAFSNRPYGKTRKRSNVVAAKLSGRT